ncbi:hypothetical protein DRQ32_12395, partial [bacterium]
GHEALDEGLIDRLVDPDVVLESASDLALGLVAEMSAGKPTLLAPVAARLAHVDPVGEESWLDQWFEPDTRRRLEAARASLLERRGPRPGAVTDDERSGGSR